MQVSPQANVARYTEFFLIAFCHDNLANYYRMNFALLQYHKYSLQDIENMIPFEREIYIAMLIKHLEEEKARLERQNQQ